MKKLTLFIIAMATVCIVGGTAYAAGWSAMDSGTAQHLIGVWGSSGTDVFAVGTAETIVHFDGTSWTQHYPESSPVYYPDVWSSSETDVFAVGSLGKIIHYDGLSWSEMNSVTTTDLKGVWGSSTNNVFAVGKFGTILHYDGNSGGNWTSIDIGTTIPNFNGIWGSSENNIFAVGDDGLIYHYDGTTWSPMDSGTTLGLESIWGSSGTDVFAVGADGVIRHYDGFAWSHMDSGTTERLYDVWCSPSKRCFATGFNGVILYYNGHTWSPEESGTTDRLYGVWGSAEGDIFAVGYYGTILTTSLPSLPACGLVPVVITGQTTSYASGDDGDLQMGVPWPVLRFTDNLDGSVTDNLTGLIWLKNAECLGVRTWYQALSDSNSLANGQCGLTDGSVAGDWRLPNLRELQSLIDIGRFDPALPDGHPFTNVYSAETPYYWSSTTHVNDTRYAWMIRMYSGYINSNLKDITQHYLWPVRGISGSCDCVASTTHVESIIAGIAPASKNLKYGQVTTTVLDDCGSPVPNAEVTGTFTGDFDETIARTTGSDGIAIITTPEPAKKPSYQFCVDDVTHSSLTYDSSGNVETCKNK